MRPFDIVVLVVILLLMSFYGLFKALRNQNRQTSAKEILHGSKVSILSSALSVCSGFLSAISLLGFTSEVYYLGTMIYWYGIMYMISFPIVAFIFLPVLYNLKFTSIYEYLEKRFNFPCRFLASITFSVQIILYISVALYAPSLALSSITTIPLIFSILLTACLAAIYVSLGGARASIYTSSVQMVLVLVSLAVIFFISLSNYSPKDIVETAIEGGRLRFFDFRVDPRIRHSVWSLLIGGSGTILFIFAGNQLTVQRYLAMPSLSSAKKVVLLNIPFNFLILSLYVGIGLIIFRAYADCDPGLKSKDQLLPYFVVDKISQIPGIVGLFAAAIYSAGLSTVSASYSALAAVVIEDIIKQFRLKVLRKQNDLSQKTVVLLARILPVIFCFVSMLLAFLCSFLHTLMLQISLTVFGIAGGPVLGAFSLGFFFPYIKGKAAFIGQFCSTLICVFIAIGAIVETVSPIPLPLDRSCGDMNATVIHYNASDPTYGMVGPLESDSWLIQIYRISYQYYSTIAVLIAIAVAHIAQLLFSVFTRNAKGKTPVDEDLLSPLLKFSFMKKNVDDRNQYIGMQQKQTDAIFEQS